MARGRHRGNDEGNVAAESRSREKLEARWRVPARRAKLKKMRVAATR